MARRKYPFYHPVNHRVADSYRRDVSRGIRKILDPILFFGGCYLLVLLIQAMN